MIKPRMKKKDGFIIFQMKFEKGDVLTDHFPPKGSILYDEYDIDPSDWVSKHTIFFIKNGSFLLTDSVGRQYEVTNSLHPIPTSPSHSFQYEALEDESSFICISSATDDLIQGDAWRVILTPSEQYCFDVGNEDVWVFVNHGKVTKDKIVLKEGLTKMPQNDSIVLKAHTDSNLIIINNIRDYVFENLGGEPSYAKDRRVN